MKTALEMLKAKLGISTDVRDKYLEKILEGLEEELESIQGVDLDLVSSPSHLMFLVDYAEYRYRNRDEPNMPRHLQWRLHNLVISHSKGETDE